jgi:hypothetical protein
MRWISVVALAALAAPGQAWAAESEYMPCDGYPAPGKKSDGITKDSWLWGLASTSADIRPTDQVRLSERGLRACDRALADPLLKPEYVLRRVHLLQSKALHELATGKPEIALATLDGAAAIPLEPAGLRQRGLGLANQAIRVLALGELGRRDEAFAEIAAIRAARPYSPSVQRLAGTLRLRLDTSLETYFAELRQRQPNDPGVAVVAALEAMLAGRNREVIAFTDGLVFNLPRMRGGWSLEGGGIEEHELIKLRAMVAALRAYALAAEGQGGQSAATLAEARLELAAAKTEPQPSAPGKKITSQQYSDFYRRKAEADLGERTLATWTRLIALRGRIGTLSAEQFFAELKTFDQGDVGCMADLIANLKEPEPAQDAQRRAALKDYLAETEAARIKREKNGLGDILQLLPRPETAENQPRFKGAGDGYFLSDNGYSTRQMDRPDQWTVRFTNLLATHATVEELALASAASLARKKGFGGFVLTSRRTLERTTHVTSYGLYGGGSWDQNSGREAQLVVVLANQNQLPDELKGAEWRYFQADKVLADLAAQHAAVALKQR